MKRNELIAADKIIAAGAASSLRQPQTEQVQQEPPLLSSARRQHHVSPAIYHNWLIKASTVNTIAGALTRWPSAVMMYSFKQTPRTLYALQLMSQAKQHNNGYYLHVVFFKLQS